MQSGSHIYLLIYFREEKLSVGNIHIFIYHQHNTPYKKADVSVAILQSSSEHTTEKLKIKSSRQATARTISVRLNEGVVPSSPQWRYHNLCRGVSDG